MTHLFSTSSGGRSNCIGTALAPEDCSTQGTGHELSSYCLTRDLLALVSSQTKDPQDWGDQQTGLASTNLMYDAAM